MAEKTNITRQAPRNIIEEDIVHTRQELGETVNAIQEKISPARLKEEATGRIRSRVRERTSRIRETAKEAGSTVVSRMKTNPVPFAMVSVGAAWLLFSRMSGNGQLMAEGGARVREKGSRFAGKARQSVSRFRGAAQERTVGAKNRFRQMVHENPLGMFFSALAVGAAFGLAIPESRKERDIMGSASDSLLTRAKETAQKTIEKAQHAAEKAVQAAETEFRKTA